MRTYKDEEEGMLQYEVQHRPQIERQREHRGVKCSYRQTQHGGKHVVLHVQLRVSNA